MPRSLVLFRYGNCTSVDGNTQLFEVDDTLRVRLKRHMVPPPDWSVGRNLVGKI